MTTTSIDEHDSSVTRSVHADRAGRRPSVRRHSIALTALIWAGTLYFLIPLVWLLFSATKSNSGLFSSFGFWFAEDFALWDNLVELFQYKGGLFGRWTLNSLWYSATAASLASIVSTMAGYAFAKFRFRGGTLLFSITLGSIMIPATALAVPQFVLASTLGMTNSPLAVIIPAVASPIGVYIMRVYAVDAVPDSILEAARMDGAGEWRIFFQIAVRAMTPGFITVFLLSLVGSWNNYMLPLLMIRDPEYFPITVGLANLNAASQATGGADVLFSMVLTGALVSVIPLLIAFAYLQRYWQTGLTAGAVKA